MKRLAWMIALACWIPNVMHGSEPTEAGEAATCEPSATTTSVSLEELPRGELCRGAHCPGVGSLSWLGRTDSGTRFWLDASGAGLEGEVSLDQLRRIESDFRKFQRPDRKQTTVIRVYREDGTFEEREIRFEAPPRDFLLEMRKAERAAEALNASPPTADTWSMPRWTGWTAAGSELSYFPIQLVPEATLPVADCQ